MAAAVQKISEDVLQVLDAAQKDGPRLVLVGQLDRKLYQAANDVLMAAGGKWNRSAKAHVFEGDAAEAIEPLILTGEFVRGKDVQQQFGQFYSTEEVARRVAFLADIEPGCRVLEPSAGRGAIAEVARDCHGRVTCVEIDAENYAALAKLVSADGIVEVIHGDFLAQEPSPTFDRVVMNPPFAGQADIDHVLHAAKFLKPGGRLVSVMSLGVMFRENRKTTDFRAFVESKDGTFERLPDNSFKASGTSVNTCIVAFNA